MSNEILYWLIISLIVMSCLFFALSAHRFKRMSKCRSELADPSIDRKFTDPILLAKVHSNTIVPVTNAGTGRVSVHFNKVKETIRYNKKKPIIGAITKELSHELDTITESSNED